MDEENLVSGLQTFGVLVVEKLRLIVGEENLCIQLHSGVGGHAEIPKCLVLVLAGWSFLCLVIDRTHLSVWTDVLHVPRFPSFR